MDSLPGKSCKRDWKNVERLPVKEIEKRLITSFRKTLWTPFAQAVKEFGLINANDHVAVGLSGGKDSLLCAKLLQELQKHGGVPFKLSFITMDPGYSSDNRVRLEDHFKYLNIDVHIFDKKVFEVIESIAKEYPCYLCARIRRGALYEKAQSLGANKLALGHHFDDVIETIMLNILCSGKYQTMMPKLKSKNFENMELIRPLYYLKEPNIIRFTEEAGLTPLDCGCTVAAQKTSSKRYEIKQLINSLKKNFKDVEKCIFQSSKNIYLDAIIGWHDKDGRHNFQDEY